MGTDLRIKNGDTRDWSFTISDAAGDALDLTGAVVEFVLRVDEGAPNSFFVRSTGGTGSDYITVGTPASDGGVSITPTASDWVEMSDVFGVYVGEFRVTASGGDIQYTQDVEIDVQEALI